MGTVAALRQTLRLVLRLSTWCSNRIVGTTAAWFSAVERTSAVVESFSGDQLVPSDMSRVVLFCHFDRHGRVREHTRGYIEALIQEGLDVVFVTNSGHLSEQDRLWLRLRVTRIVIRRNVGYDFAAWRDAMLEAKLPAPQTSLLILVNDSVYGPFRPLEPILAKIDFRRADVWGLTDSWQHRYHLQSYFLAFGAAAVQSPGFGAFWRNVRNVRSKWWVIRNYEIGLTQRLISAGLQCMAIWPYTDLVDGLKLVESGPRAAHGGDGSPVERKSAEPALVSDLPNATMERSAAGSSRLMHFVKCRVAMNPTADLWRILIDCGYPFIKRELLRENPSGVPDLADWRAALGTADDANKEIILRDLKRTLKGTSP